MAGSRPQVLAVLIGRRPARHREGPAARRIVESARSPRVMTWKPSGLALARGGQGLLITPTIVGPGPLSSPHPSALHLHLAREGTARMGEGRGSCELSAPGGRGGAGVLWLIGTLVGVLISHCQLGGALCTGVERVSVERLAWSAARRREGGGVVVESHTLLGALFRK